MSGRKRERHGRLKKDATRITEKWHDLDVAPGRAMPSWPVCLPHPAADANKYTRGHLSLVVGSAAYPGAACLAAAAGERGRGRLHRGVLRREIDDHRARLAAVVWWCATGERGSRPRRRRPGRATRRPASSAAASTRRKPPSPRFSWRRCGAGRPLCSSTGAPSGFSPTPPACAWPASGPPPGARRCSRPTAARRRGWPKAPGRPWKRPRTRPTRGTRSPLAEAAAALSPASRATLAEADPGAGGPGLRARRGLRRRRGPQRPRDLHRLARRHRGGHGPGHVRARQGRHGRRARGHRSAPCSPRGFRPPRRRGPRLRPARRGGPGRRGRPHRHLRQPPRISSPTFPTPSAPSPPRRFGGPYARARPHGVPWTHGPARTARPGAVRKARRASPIDRG